MEIFNLITSLFVLLIVSKIALVAIITTIAVVFIMKIGDEEKETKKKEEGKREPVLLGVISEASYRLGWKYVNTTRFIFALLSLYNMYLPILYFFAWFITSGNKNKEENEVEIDFGWEEEDMPEFDVNDFEIEEEEKGFGNKTEEFELSEGFESDELETGITEEENTDIEKEEDKPFKVVIDKEWE